jgi:hypothetical protein
MHGMRPGMSIYEIKGSVHFQICKTLAHSPQSHLVTASGIVLHCVLVAAIVRSRDLAVRQWSAQHVHTDHVPEGPLLIWKNQMHAGTSLAIYDMAKTFIENLTSLFVQKVRCGGLGHYFFALPAQ